MQYNTWEITECFKRSASSVVWMKICGPHLLSTEILFLMFFSKLAKDLFGPKAGFRKRGHDHSSVCEPFFEMTICQIRFEDFSRPRSSSMFCFYNLGFFIIRYYLSAAYGCKLTELWTVLVVFYLKNCETIWQLLSKSSCSTNWLVIKSSFLKNAMSFLLGSNKGSAVNLPLNCKTYLQEDPE